MDDMMKLMAKSALQTGSYTGDRAWVQQVADTGGYTAPAKPSAPALAVSPYKPTTAAQLTSVEPPASAKAAPTAPDVTDEEKMRLRRRDSLILGSERETLGSGDGSF
jgi:hypothetical protein